MVTGHWGTHIKVYPQITQILTNQETYDLSLRAKRHRLFLTRLPELAIYIFVQHTADQGLIGNTLLQRTCLQAA